jgi:hypothetical protein
MLNTYPELAVGGVLVAPFVAYVAAALILFICLRLLLPRTPIRRLFVASPIVEACGYVLILAALIIFF